MSKLRILIEEMVDNKLKGLILNETFKSKKMQALAAIKTQYPGGSGYLDVMGALVLFGMKASEVTDDQIEVTSASEAKSLMKEYPKGLAFIIDDKELVAVLMGGKHVSINGIRRPYINIHNNYYSAADTKKYANDPKYIRNNKDQYSSTDISVATDRATQYDKTGRSASSRISMGDILSPSYMCYFLKTANNKNQQDYRPIKNDYFVTIQREIVLLKMRHEQYAATIKSLRSKSRTKAFSEPIMALIRRLHGYQIDIEHATRVILNYPNPGELAWDIDSMHFASTYTDAAKQIISAIKEYISGSSNGLYLKYAENKLDALAIQLRKFAELTKKKID